MRPGRDGSPAEAVMRAAGEVGRDLLAVDWTSSPLGEPRTWPPALVAALRTMLGSRFAMWMAWGDELAFLCNDRYRRDTLGMKYPWALGRPAREVWAEIWPDIGPRIAGVMRDGTATWDEALLLFLERSGYAEETYHSFSYSPLADDDGETVGMLCVVAEETERVIGERRMAALNGLAAALSGARTVTETLAAAQAALVGADRDVPFALIYLLEEGGARARLRAATSAALGAFPDVVERDDPAWPAAALAGEPPRAVPPSALGLPAELPAGAWGAPPTRVVPVGLRAPGGDGLAGFAVVGLDPHRPADDGYVAFVELLAGQVASALAGARAFESERLRAERLAELDRAKTMFFTNISHELRTPLTLMLGPLDDAARDAAEPLPPAQAERVALAARNGRRLLALVNTLLDFSRLQDGRLAATTEPVDLARETAELVGMFRSAFEAGGIRLDVDCAPLPHPVRVDRRMWEQIVTNLVSNAFKHTFEGSVSVALRAEPDAIVLEVADTGDGIPERELPRVFERFHRVEGARARSAEGSGIGLALVRELVGLHGGEVGIASTHGTGTTLLVRLPATLVARGAEPVGRPSAGDAAAARVAEAQTWVAAPDGLALVDGAGRDETARDDARARILVADDNADMRGYLVRLLRDAYRVEAVANGAVALERVRADPPDLVLSDVMMPALDGFGLLDALRADAALRDVPVILLSARAGPESAVAGLDLGAEDYLVKPFGADDLLGRVRARLAAGRDRRRRVGLAQLASALAAADGVDGLVERLLRWAGPALGATNAAVALLDDDAGHVRYHRALPVGHGIDERYGVVAASADAPSCAVIREGRPIVLDSPEAIRALSPTVAGECAAVGVGAFAIVPVATAAGRTIGSLTLAWGAARALDADDRDLVARAAAIVGDAVGRIHAAEREHLALERFQERLLDVDLRTTAAAIAVRYRPADDAILIGGDWYDILSLEDGRVGISVGDVVGKGISAATVMGQLRSALGAAAATVREPSAVVGIVDSYARRLPDALGTTLAYLTLGADGSVRSCRAGHPPPLIATADGVSFLSDGGRAPLAATAAAGWGVDAGTALLPPCGLLLVFTDGLVERRREPLDVGLARLAAAVEEHLHLPVGPLCDAVVEAMLPAGGTFNDDVALVAARRPGATASHLADVFPARPGELSGARRRLRAWLEAAGVDASAIDAALLAVGEASANAIEHGGSSGSRRIVAVEASLHAGVLHASVTDTGRWRADSASGPARGRGRGFTIMRAMMDDVAIRRERLGTTILFRLRVEARAGVPAGG